MATMPRLRLNKRTAAAFIEEHYPKGWTYERMAEHLRVSVATISWLVTHLKLCQGVVPIRIERRGRKRKPGKVVAPRPWRRKWDKP